MKIKCEDYKKTETSKNDKIIGILTNKNIIKIVCR